jgi:MarR family multiple antibiotic resistance transcriptional regulator
MFSHMTMGSMQMGKVKELGLPHSNLYLMTEIVRLREKSLTGMLSRLDLTLHEWRALRVLYCFEGDVPMSVLIEHSQTDRTALGRTIDRLVQRGWVSRFPDPEDKRAVYLRTNPSSQGVFTEAFKLVSRLDEDMLAAIDAKETAVLSRVLAKMAGVF